jgi:hypothetical protein
VLLESVPERCDVLIEYPGFNTPTHRRIVEAVAAAAGPLMRVNFDDLDLFAGTATLTVRVIDGRAGASFDGQVLIEATSELGAKRWLAQGPEIRLDGLSLGTWEVSVAAEGLGARTTRVKLIDDQLVEVRLGQGVAISGLVTCAAGPLAGTVQMQVLEVVSKHLTVTRTDAVGRFSFGGMAPGEYLLSVEPFESSVFTQSFLRRPQSHASPAPIKVLIEAGTVPAAIELPVVPVAPLSVLVVPDAATRGSRSVWSWAQELLFDVTDDHGGKMYTGGPSDVMVDAAKLVLCLAEGRYTVTVRRRGEVLGERALDAGKSWRLDTR